MCYKTLMDGEYVSFAGLLNILIDLKFDIVDITGTSRIYFHGHNNNSFTYRFLYDYPGWALIDPNQLVKYPRSFVTEDEIRAVLQDL